VTIPAGAPKACGVTGKRCFATEQEAHAELKNCQRKRAAGELNRLECRAYLCRLCGSWHLTSRALRR